MRLVSRTSLRAEWTAGVVLSGWSLFALSAASLLLPPVAIVVAFGFVSAAALREFSSLSRPAGAWPELASYMLVAMQYGFVALGAWTPAMWCLPLAAALGLPLLAVIAGDTRDLDTRSAHRFFGVMLTVYSLSHAPALLVLDVADAPPAELLVFLVAIALGSGALHAHLSGERTHELRAIAIVALMAAVAGAALSWLTPFTMAGAAVAAVLAGVCAALAERVMRAMAPDSTDSTLTRIAALAFAAPLFFHLTRALVAS